MICFTERFLTVVLAAVNKRISAYSQFHMLFTGFNTLCVYIGNMDTDATQQSASQQFPSNYTEHNTRNNMKTLNQRQRGV